MPKDDLLNDNEKKIVADYLALAQSYLDSQKAAKSKAELDQIELTTAGLIAKFWDDHGLHENQLLQLMNSLAKSTSELRQAVKNSPDANVERLIAERNLLYVGIHASLIRTWNREIGKERLAETKCLPILLDVNLRPEVRVSFGQEVGALAQKLSPETLGRLHDEFRNTANPWAIRGTLFRILSASKVGSDNRSFILAAMDSEDRDLRREAYKHIPTFPADAEVLSRLQNAYKRERVSNPDVALQVLFTFRRIDVGADESHLTAILKQLHDSETNKELAAKIDWAISARAFDREHHPK